MRLFALSIFIIFNFFFHFQRKCSNLVIEKCHISLVDFIKSKDLEAELIVAQVAIGLDYLHSQNIIHGALKPQNVMIWRKSESPKQFVAKITDYGLMDNAKLEVTRFPVLGHKSCVIWLVFG
jgi:serine/threonine protein kinase